MRGSSILYYLKLSIPKNKVNTVYSKAFFMIYIYLIHYKTVDVLNQPYTVIDRNIVIQSHRITIKSARDSFIAI